ncbi:MAG: hypothetical protein ACRDQ5_01355 [Sciscionella sp.]
MTDALHPKEAPGPEDAAATLTPSEELDEDDLGADPVERGVDPPEDWSAADRHGMTAREQAEGENLDERLSEELPDVGDAPLERPVADTPLDQLDSSIDDNLVPGEPADGENDAIVGEGRPLPEELG